MTKRNLLIIITFVIIGMGYWNYLKSPLDKNNLKNNAFVIKKGESIASIAQRLEEEKIIHSSLAFKVYLKLSNNSSNIEAGDFKLSPSMSLGQVVDTLKSGSIDKWITLVEGLRVEEYAKELSEKLKVKSEKFIEVAKPLEGYLFPDTYLINPDSSPEDIVGILRDNFNKKFDDNSKRKMKTLGLTEKEGVILASIVEREARTDKVRTQVASILLRRFKIGMGLYADATIQYALGYQEDEKTWWKKNLTKEDLKINSPFNTYLYRGLPPAPICNPSLSSLQAVANADSSSPYLYYYHDLKGNTYYAKTLEEHNENIAKYR